MNPFNQFMTDINAPLIETSGEAKIPKGTFSQLLKRVADFEERINDDYAEFTKRLVGQLAYTVRNSQKIPGDGPWDELSGKVQKAVTATKEKIEKVASSFIESTQTKLTSHKLSEVHVNQLKQNWEGVIDTVRQAFDKFTTNYNKFINKFKAGDPILKETKPVLKCANKDYLMVSFISLLDGTRLHELSVDIDGITDWVAFANTVGVPPCNVPGLTWEKIVRETKEEL